MGDEGMWAIRDAEGEDEEGGEEDKDRGGGRREGEKSKFHSHASEQGGMARIHQLPPSLFLLLLLLLLSCFSADGFAVSPMCHGMMVVAASRRGSADTGGKGLAVMSLEGGGAEAPPPAVPRLPSLAPFAIADAELNVAAGTKRSKSSEQRVYGSRRSVESRKKSTVGMKETAGPPPPPSQHTSPLLLPASLPDFISTLLSLASSHSLSLILCLQA
eukprot:767649-Hanusia_phi.AAC.2